MDNINHHPKQVVDSIWQALQKEWEFEGFTHRAREMFERSATKCMRNRKMQLKYKCQKIVDESKPDDVNDMYWKKIKKTSKKITKGETSANVEDSYTKSKGAVVGTEEIPVDFGEDKQVTVFCDVSGCPSEPSSGSGNQLTKTEDVDAKILKLQSELRRLQKSRELGFQVSEDQGGVAMTDVNGSASMHEISAGAKKMKENVQPLDKNILSSESRGGGKSIIEAQGPRQPLLTKGKGVKVAELEEDAESKEAVQYSALDAEDSEMNCSDLVRVFAYTGGIKEQIGKAIVMGLASSKFAKKEIPQAWRSIKVISFTEVGGQKICPYPPTWAEQLKSKSVKEVNGRIILWPDMLLRSIAHV